VLVAYCLVCSKRNPPTHTVGAGSIMKVFGSARLEQIEVNRYQWLGDLKYLHVSFHKTFSLTVAFQEPCGYVGDPGRPSDPCQIQGV
jgi:hypothetical protein